MKFRNSNPSAGLAFECGGTDYKVPVGGTVEIPERFAYAVKAMGLALELVTEESELEEATKPDPKPAKR